MKEQCDHIPVMRNQVLDWIAPKPGGRYLDATVGLGGHAIGLMERAVGQAWLLGLDRDVQALRRAQAQLTSFGQQVTLAQTSFQYFALEAQKLGWDFFDGVIVDLGVSSLQLDSPERGFSFLYDGPLDMRMDPSFGAPPAAQIVNTASCERLKKIIWEYGEEPMAGRIARAIVSAREQGWIENTLALARIVERAYPGKRRALARNHPATKTFQALRIEVNSELQELKNFLHDIIDYLSPGARIAVISFHSLEDRLVKHAFKRESSACLCPREYPVCQCGHTRKLRILTRKPLLPEAEEQQENPRSRSAKLRVAERLQEEQA